MTPEGKVKNSINKALKVHEVGMYKYMPVPGGFGKPTLDYVGAYRGVPYAIEAKAPGKHPTPRQVDTIASMQAASIMVFVIDGENGGLEALREWLTQIDQMVTMMQTRRPIETPACASPKP